MKKISHSDFVKGVKLDEIKLLFSLDEALPVAIGFLGDSKLTKFFEFFLSLKRKKVYVWLMSFILLLTPLRFLLFISVIYFALSHQLTSISKKLIKNRMMEDEEFYNKMTDESIVVTADKKEKTK